MEIAANELNKLLKYPSAGITFHAKETQDKSTYKVFLYPKEKNGKVYIEQMPEFSARVGEELFFSEALHVGIGPLDELDADRLAELFKKIYNRMKFYQKKIEIIIPDSLIEKFKADEIANLGVTAAGISLYSTHLLKTESKSSKAQKKKVQLNKIVFVTKDSKQCQKSLDYYSEIVDHINGMRQVQALPGNYLTPASMEKRARQMAKKFGLKIQVLKKKDLEKINAGGILAVSRGSEREPRMIILEYNPSQKKVPTLALVGKGVTFDTGGISLKPSSDMHEMKYDMSGSALALHSIASIAEKKLPVRVVATIGMVENMPDGAAFKPGDVYTSYKGLTIEVQNTDAEGRLVLGDLLSYTEKKYSPDYMVDFATLTGSVVVALGYYHAGLFSNNEKLTSLLEKSSTESLEPLWEMPMGRLYKEELKSDIADYNNIGGRYGGSISAAEFLRLFVDEKTPWAHIDIAGIGFMKKGFNVYSKGGTGYGIRLITRLAENLSQK